MASKTIHMDQTSDLPIWRQPVALLFIMAFAMPLAFATWSALLNNFVIEAASFTGVEIGWLQTCLLYTSPSPRDLSTSRMPSSA